MRAPKIPLTVLFVLTVAACGQASRPTAVLPQQQRVSPPITAALYAVGDIDKVVNGAEQILIAACMRQHGQTYLGTGAVSVGDEDVPRPFGLEDLTLAGIDTQQAEGRGEKHESAAYGKALYGDESARTTVTGNNGFTVSKPGNGCLADAETRLLGADRNKLTGLRIKLKEASENATSRMFRDSKFLDAQRKWSKCMKSAGFKITDPTQVLGTLTSASLPSQPIAVADVHCKENTGFLSTAYARFAAVQQAELDQQPGLLEHWKQVTESEKNSARDVLSRGR